MRSYLAFCKKELLWSVRSGKLLLLAVAFAMLGVMNPVIAKLTPYLLELLSAELAENGMTITEVTVDALTSWTQFFKNIPIGLIAFVLLFGASFTREYESETLTLILTKGLKRYKIVLAKTGFLLSLWTVAYWFCFAITYLYNAYFWDNAIAKGLFPAVIFYYLFGLLVLFILVFFSVLLRGYGSVLLSLCASLLVLYLLSLIPRLSRLSPFALTDSAMLLVGGESASAFVWAVVISLVLSALLLLCSILFFNKKRL